MAPSSEEPDFKAVRQKQEADNYDTNFHMLCSQLYRLRSKYEYVKQGYEAKKVEPSRALGPLSEIIENFIDLATARLTAPKDYNKKREVSLPQAARHEHVLRRRMVLIEDEGNLFALNPNVIMGGEVCLCGKGQRKIKTVKSMQCEVCAFEKENLATLSKDLTKLLAKKRPQQQQQQQQQQ